MARLDVSPPNPCRYWRPPPSPVWLNSSIASPSARMSTGAGCFAMRSDPSVLGQALAERLLRHDQLGLLQLALVDLVRHGQDFLRLVLGHDHDAVDVRHDDVARMDD